MLRQSHRKHYSPDLLVKTLQLWPVRIKKKLSVLINNLQFPCWSNAGFECPRAYYPDSAFLAALKEYKDDPNTETEGENGDSD